MRTPVEIHDLIEDLTNRLDEIKPIFGVPIEQQPVDAHLLGAMSDKLNVLLSEYETASCRFSQMCAADGVTDPDFENIGEKGVL